MEVLPAKIQLNVGETYTLRLPGRGSAGYAWEHHTVSSSQAVSVIQEGVREKPVDGVEDRTPSSHSADILFRIHALEPGQVTLHLQLRRPWEKDRPPLSRHTLEVTVLPAPLEHLQDGA